MSGANTFMALNSLISGGYSLGQSIVTGNAYKTQAKYQKDRFEFQSQIADLRAEDAIKRGKRTANEIQKVGQRIIGTQRAAYAAQGVELDSGSALLVQEDTASQAKIDALTMKNNAYREAWGYKTQALDYTMQGQMAEYAGAQKRAESLITGGLSFASSFNKFMYYGGLLGSGSTDDWESLELKKV